MGLKGIERESGGDGCMFSTNFARGYTASITHYLPGAEWFHRCLSKGGLEICEFQSCGIYPSYGLCVNPFLKTVEVEKPSGDGVAVEDPAFQRVDSLDLMLKKGG